ncbi:hypothetical protein FRB94_011598 [Tulasnella sp. JGI-2019a]|nr:hypothetical protein FRB93_010114 [Tulasnella sp. JGI-2019a]KAG8992474.1 hypothetical protein FRB94_011598 [Tulasnella sp. JGI-2019a]
MKIWPDIVSFVPLVQADVQPIPKLGTHAPSFWPTPEDAKQGAVELIYPLKEGKKSIVVFARHLGSPFCQETIQDMYPLANEYRDIHFFLVSQSNDKVMEHYLENLAITKWFPLVTITTIPSPPPHTLYATWGISQLPLRSILSRSIRSNAKKRGKEKGIKNTKIHGSRRLNSGAFAMDEVGKVVWSHVAESADDVSDLKAAVAALKAR